MKTFHSEEDFAPYVLQFVRAAGLALFQDIYEYIIENVNLTEADWEVLPCGLCPRWFQIVRNLKSHKSLEDELVSVDRGFATPEYLEVFGEA